MSDEDTAVRAIIALCKDGDMSYEVLSTLLFSELQLSGIAVLLALKHARREWDV
jgi:hypothetical protein